VALAGQAVVAMRYVGLADNCRLTGAKVMIVAPAFHGVLSVAPGSISANPSGNENLAARLSRCGIATAPTEDVTYTPDPGYAGWDEFQFEVQGDTQSSSRFGIGVVANAGDVPPVRTEETTPALPDGKLLGVAVGRTGATFIDLDHSVVKDGVATVRTYMVFDPPLAVKGKEVVQQVGERVIDCAHRTYSEHRSYAFDEAGEEVIWTSGNSVEPIPANNANDFIARVMCDGAKLPPQNYVKGHAAALAFGRAAIRRGPPTA
jgi:hypothetical protein